MVPVPEEHFTSQIDLSPRPAKPQAPKPFSIEALNPKPSDLFVLQAAEVAEQTDSHDQAVIEQGCHQGAAVKYGFRVWGSRWCRVV